MNMYGRIQILMMSKHMNKADMTKAIGVSSGNLSDWANGRSQPSVEKLIKIADFFDVSVDYILGRDDRFPLLTPDALELIRVYDKLDRGKKSIALGAMYQLEKGIKMDLSGENNKD